MSDVTDEAQALKEYMEGLSDYYYSAGWVVNLEYDLWSALRGNPKAFASGLKAVEIDALRKLSEECGGWWYYTAASEEPAFIPLEEWKPVYDRKTGASSS